ncbi:hypothetical protein [Leptospira sp. GIMC2001]|uniref:hypothetical protein n=1 Tax=Leptospira sp. GIMC2001 TaxID=1513297 RepID=UPI00234BDBCE|nr:hypothetical protein [Leptospira sp. GIMC2001]WCL47581.1 hypothetical protein O4O04_01035 [Leptospira sp. GIMC2001]
MTSELFELTNRSKLAKSSGIVLEKDPLTIFQAIENQSTKNNLNSFNIFTPSEEKLKILKMDLSRFREAAKTLLEFRLVAQVFEIYYESSNDSLQLMTYYITETETLKNPRLSYELLLDRSAQSIVNYFQARPVSSDQEIKTFAYNLNSGSMSTDASLIHSLFTNDNFVVMPSKDHIREYTNDLRLKLSSFNNLIGSLDTRFFYIREENANSSFEIFRSIFETRIIPNIRSKSPEIDQSILSQEDDNNVLRKSLDYSGDWEHIRKLCEICLASPKLFTPTEKIFIDSILKLSIEAEGFYKKNQKSLKDKLFLQIVKKLDTGTDLDSIFLQVNLEDPESIPKTVLDALRLDREILSADWYTSKYKMSIFVKKKPTTLKLINQLIYDHHRYNSEIILFLKALLDVNEKDVFEVFQDSQFVKIYGKNLQETYLRYIPFFYKFFAWIGIKSIINAGYSKAKSLIRYSQMERQFQHEKRHEKRVNDMREARALELAKLEKEQMKLFLTQALEAMYFFQKTIPTAEEIGNFYPLLNPENLEKICSEFEFGVVENGGFHSKNLIFFPNTEQWMDQNREIRYLIDDILEGRINATTDVVQRCSLLKERLS